MWEYRKWWHTTYDCRYHIVWITKYRHPCLNSKMQKRLEWILRIICKKQYVKVISIWMEEDHVHMYVSIPLSKPIPMIVQYLKWKSSKMMRWIFEKELKSYYWKNVLWAKGYFVATIWEMNHDVIKNYVENQWKKDVLWDEVIF